MRRLAPILLAALFATAPPGAARACDCRWLAPPSPAVATEADLIFAGKALEVAERTEHTSRMYWGGAASEVRFIEKWVTFEVSRGWRGVDRDTIEIAVDNSDCAFWFEPGTSYVVFANRALIGKPFTSACTRTRKLDDAAAILGFLGAARYEPRPKKPVPGAGAWPKRGR